MIKLDLRPCNGEPELSDPNVTGKFAEQMGQLAATAQLPPWCGYLGWSGGNPLGFGGFISAPDAEGVVEIGYITFPAHENCGVATAIAAGLLTIARSHGAQSVIAHSLPFENASTRVLVGNGFVQTEGGIDPDEGPVWSWHLAL